MKTVQLLTFFMCFTGNSFCQKLENPYTRPIDLKLPATEITPANWKRKESSLLLGLTDTHSENNITPVPYIPAYTGPSGRIKDKTQLGESLFHATGLLLNALH